MESLNAVTRANKTLRLFITLVVQFWLLFLVITPRELAFVKCYPVSSLQFGRVKFSGSLVFSQFQGSRETSAVKRNSKFSVRLKVWCVENSSGDRSVLHERRSVHDSLDSNARRRLKQEADSGGAGLCSLGRTEVESLYEPDLRQWVIDDEAFTRLSTLQTIVNCTEEGDIILLNTTERISVDETIVLSKSLTISAYVEDTQLLDNVFPRAENKVAFSCPSKGSFFRIMNPNITLANLAIEGCHFEGQVAASVISVERCQGQSADNVLRLHHVLIQNISNTVGSGVIDVDKEACVSTEMVDVQISNNTCGDVACIQAFGSLSLTEVNISSNSRSGLVGENAQAVIHLEANNAGLTINTVRAQGNRLRVFYVKDVKSVSISYSNFTENGNSTVSFGGVLRLDNSNGLISNTSFNNNTASAGGSLSIVDSILTINDQTSFSNDVAEMGATIHIESSQIVGNQFTVSNCHANHSGSVYVESNSNVVFSNCTFNNNEAVNHGGALYVRSSELLLDTVNLLNNSCSTSGGAIFAEDSELNVRRTSFTNNTAEVQNGGAIRLDDQSSMNLYWSNFVGNRARFGGAIVSSTVRGLQIEHCVFMGNHAREQGAALESNPSNVTISGSNFTRNSAKVGTVISANRGLVQVSDSVFSNNLATIKCGALQVEFGGHMILDNSICTGNSAARGGCACVGRSAQLLSVSSLFQDNEATTQYGGAIFVNERYNLNITLQLENCTLHRNKARFGGAIYVERDANANETCYENRTSCGGVVLLATTLTENNANVAGSAIFANDENAIRVNCNKSSRSPVTTAISMEDYRNLTVLSNETVCSSWTSNSSLNESRPPWIAFRARKAVVEVIETEQDGVEVEYLEDEVRITNFTSGDPLPGMQVRIVDSFGHSPAFVPNLRLMGTLVSLDELFQGTISLNLSNGVHVLTSLRGYGRPGNYTLRWSFNPNGIPAVRISVEVRRCIVGEKPSADGVICERCGDNFFRFVEGSSKECQTCPTSAKCSASFIFPEDGYWNNHPCQTVIKKCLETSACTNDERFNKLLNITSNHQNCSYKDGKLSEYTSALCSTGYSGLLCGSCASGYGRSGTFTCRLCWSRFISICVLIATTVWLLTLAFLVIRSNLSTTQGESGHSRILPQTTDDQTRASTPQTPINIEMVRRMCAGVVSGVQLESRPSTSEEETVEIKDVEIAKWKVGEMLKVIVNYAQTVAIAAYLNVDWTASITTAFAVAETIGGFATHAVTRSIYCLSDQNTPLHGPLFSMITGLVQPIVVCLIIILLLSMIYRPLLSNRVLLLKKAALVVSVVAYISYFNIAKLVTKVFPCVDLVLYESIDQSSEKAFWASDTSLECYERKHLVLLILGSFVLLFFTITFPTLTLLLLLYHRSKDTLGASWVFDTLGFLYKAFHKKYVYWESFVLLRKAVLSLILVFSYRLGPELQSQLAAFILVFSLYLQTRCNPYGNPFSELNDYESLSLFMTSLTFISASFFHHEDTLESTKILIASLLLGGNISFFLFLALKFLRYLIQYCRVYVNFLGVPCPNTTPFWRVLRLFLSLKIGPLLDSN